MANRRSLAETTRVRHWKGQSDFARLRLERVKRNHYLADEVREFRFGDYCRAIPGYHVGHRLSEADECCLIERAQGGDIEARNALVEHHTPFIIDQIKRCLPAWTPYHEYVGEGAQKFMDCIRRFDPSKGYKLLTFAGIAIQRHIWRLWQKRGVIRVPVRSVKERTTKFEDEKERAMKARSLESPMRRDGRRALTLRDFLSARTPAPDSRDEQHEGEMARMNAALASLAREDPKGAAVLLMRSRGMLLSQVGEVYGVTGENIRQTQIRAMDRLRVMMGVAVAA